MLRNIIRRWLGIDDRTAIVNAVQQEMNDRFPDVVKTIATATTPKQDATEFAQNSLFPIKPVAVVSNTNFDVSVDKAPISKVRSESAMDFYMRSLGGFDAMRAIMCKPYWYSVKRDPARGNRKRLWRLNIANRSKYHLTERDAYATLAQIIEIHDSEATERRIPGVNVWLRSRRHDGGVA